ncbi:hypothetical protein L1049_026894 [Liquidambar formosana]|uniref:RING-type E3 ubiquitin transferase n=1 Tax=Liquidambar formosana TaxID=63359 RepID=A0AAP0R7P7_LIQFO
MGNEVAEFVEIPYYCTIKVHRSMCLELKKYIDRISQIFPAIESVRPRCSSGLQALCLLISAMDKAKLLIQHCCESSKLYLAMTADKIALRCERIQNTLGICLSQIQNLVPTLLAAKISGIVDDLRGAKFIVESTEDEAGNVLLALLRQDIVASDSINKSELNAIELAVARLHITSPMALLIERRSIKKLHDKVRDTDPTKKKILRYLLYLLKKYGDSIKGHQTEITLASYEESLHQSIEPEHIEEARDETQADASSIPELPEEFKCPLSMRLMYDPVVIASGQTFERFWIEKWLNEGNETCPKTHMKLSHLSLTPNYTMKDLISNWCLNQGVTIPNPCLHPFSSSPLSRNCTSASSIASFGSSIYNRGLQFGNVSLYSSDPSIRSNVLDVENDDEFDHELPLMNAGSHKFQYSSVTDGMNLAFLSKLAALPWGSQRKAVADINAQLKDNNQACNSTYSNSYIKPLIRFLNDARDQCDIKSQRDGAQVLLAFLDKSRSRMPPLHEDAIHVLASFLDSEITEEALAIIEVLSSQQHHKSEIVAFGVLPSIRKVLDTQIMESHILAMKILCNLSSSSDIAYHIVYLDFIPKLAPFLVDPTLSSYCIEIFRNLCNTEEARIAVAENNLYITSLAELLETGSKEEQEHAVGVFLSLCHQHADYCQLVMNEGIIPSLVNISIDGNSRGKEIAKELLQFLRHATEENVPESSAPNAVLSLDISPDTGGHSKRKNSSPKAFRYLGFWKANH